MSDRLSNRSKTNQKLVLPNWQKRFHNVLTKTAETVRLVLSNNNFNGRVARYINTFNRTKRIRFARTYRIMEISFWNKVLFTDESKFNLFRLDGQSYVWQKPNEELKEKNL